MDTMDGNPYKSPEAEPELKPTPKTEPGVMAVPGQMGLCSIGIGSLLAVLGAFPVAALVALVFRFPIPFTGYCSGLEAVLPSCVAVLFYGCIGGFPLLAVLGAVGGLAAFLIGRPDGKKTFRLTVAFALVVDLLATLILAVLDKIIGPW